MAAAAGAGIVSAVVATNALRAGVPVRHLLSHHQQVHVGAPSDLSCVLGVCVRACACVRAYVRAPALLWAEACRGVVRCVNRFNIGVFPIIMMSALVLFVEPSTVAKFWTLLKLSSPSASSNTAPDLEASRPDTAPLAHTATTARQPPTSARTVRQTATVVALLAMAAFHVAFPLRWLVLYPSHPSWTEEGHHGAWHMMLRSKKGWAMVQAVDVNGQVNGQKSTRSQLVLSSAALAWFGAACECGSGAPTRRST